jgi:phage shock protein PspC (stress-responsive transcriptional regulator)
MILLALGFTVFFLVFWIWMLVDCIKSDLRDSDKLVWVLIIIFLSWLGALIYLMIVKSNRNYGGFRIKVQKTRKKLYRSRKNRIIAGVCGGIGEYFGIDPTIIRLLWVLVTFFGGWGILAYIVFWIIIPEKK